MLMQLSFADWQKIKNVNKNKQVISDSVVQRSTPWVVFLWRPAKGSHVCGFSSSLCMIILNPLPLCSSRSHKYSNYDTPTYIVSSNLCLFICLQPTDFPERALLLFVSVRKCVYSLFTSCFLHLILLKQKLKRYVYVTEWTLHPKKIDPHSRMLLRS